MKKLPLMKLQVVIQLKMHSFVNKLVKDESGMGMVEIALIIIIIIALGLTFKKAINDFLVSIFSSFDIAGYK